MRQLLTGILVACACANPALAQVSIGIATPGISIGVQLPLYPNLVAVPGYPVYYAPSLNTNYFFYDGMYWVYQGNNWYSSAWYNGPWALVSPLYVPVYVLRVPVRYYRVPPPYFRPWRADAPPRWGEHWGNDWQRQRKGWDQWNRHTVPAPAPLPVYQRQYTGDRYPQEVERQRALNEQNYRYRPRDPIVRDQHRPPAVQDKPQARGPEPQQRPSTREVQPQDFDRPSPASKQKGPSQGPGPGEQQARGPAPQSQPQSASPQKALPQEKANDKNAKGNDHGRGQGGGKPQ